MGLLVVAGDWWAGDVCVGVCVEGGQWMSEERRAGPHLSQGLSPSDRPLNG